MTAVFAVPVETFDTPPVLAAAKTPGAWYVDRYAPAAFESVVFDGGNRLRLGISSADSAANRPPAFSGTFYSTQGRKYDLDEATFLAADLYVGTDWGTSDRRAGLWATAVDAGGTVTAYPIIDFITGTGFRVWTGAGWQNIGYPSGFSYGKWYNLRMVLTPASVEYYIDSALVHTWDTSATGSAKFDNVILQGFNFGGTYDVYWDNVSPMGEEPPVVSTPASSTWSVVLIAIAGVGLTLFVRRERVLQHA